MTRLISIGAAVVAVALVAPAFAQSQAEIAAKLNDEGKEQMYSSNYAQASAKFREAVARVPEPKYFFNLCAALFQEGKFGEALTACAAVDKNNPTPDLSQKASKMIGKIKSEAEAQGLKVEQEGGGASPGGNDCAANPTAPGCSAVPPPETCQTNPGLPECQQPVGAPPPVVGRPPTGTGVFASVTPDNKYIWTLGGELFGGGGKIGAQFADGENVYGTAMGGVRIKGDFLFNPAQRMGSQAWVSFQNFTAGQEQVFGAATLSVVDLGIGVYKHLCPPGTERLCLTPLVGASLALYSPEFDQFDGEKQFNYAAIGGRAEFGLQYAFGTRMEHVLSVTLGAHLYTGAFSGPSFDNADCIGAPGDHCLTAEEAGLDKGGVVGYVGVGYTHRFSTPLGSSPFVTLE